MPVPWLRILNAVLGLSDIARTVAGRALPPDDRLAVPGRPGALEARLAGVVVAALKEAFDRDHQRLQIEREQIEAERLRAERALKLELRRQAVDREVGRLRLMAGVAAAGWLGTLILAAQSIDGPGSRAGFGAGWVLLLAALAASFIGQATVARALDGSEGRAAPAASGTAGALAPWLLVAGLAASAFAIL